MTLLLPSDQPVLSDGVVLARICVIGSKNAFCGSHAGYRPRAGSVQFVGSIVKTIVTSYSPIPIISPLNDTLDDASPSHVFSVVLPDQPVPDTLLGAVTLILVNFPEVVVNVPPLMKFVSWKSIILAVIVIPSLVKDCP